MSKKVLKYKDVKVAPSSNLGQALLAGDKKLAEKLYKEVESVFKKTYGDAFDKFLKKNN